MTDANVTLPTPAPNTNGTAVPGDKPKGSDTTIKPGVFEMIATDADMGFTAGSGDAPPAPQVAILLEFADGPYKGQSLTWYGFFTEKTKVSTARALRTLGMVGNDIAEDLKQVIGGKAPCTVQVEPDLEGVLRARVRFIGGGAIAMKQSMTEDQKKAFAASFKGFMTSIATPAAKPEGAKPAAEEKSGSQGTPTGPAGKKFF